MKMNNNDLLAVPIKQNDSGFLPECPKCPDWHCPHLHKSAQAASNCASRHAAKQHPELNQSILVNAVRGAVELSTTAANGVNATARLTPRDARRIAIQMLEAAEMAES